MVSLKNQLYKTNKLIFGDQYTVNHAAMQKYVHNK